MFQKFMIQATGNKNDQIVYQWKETEKSLALRR